MKTFSEEYEQEMISYNESRSKKSFSHQYREAYGLIEDFIDDDCKTFIDYGCGEGAAADYFNEKNDWNVVKYDPFKTEYRDISLEPVDCVFSIDVLEHVEIAMVGSFIEAVNDLSSKQFVHCIDLWPAKKTLSDGRNAHITLLKPDDWKNLFETICSKDFDLEFDVKDNPEDLVSKRSYMKEHMPYPSRILIKGKRKQ